MVSDIIPEESWKKGRKVWDSPEWKEKRLSFLEDKTCEWCGTTKDLQIHHRKSALAESRERANLRGKIITQILQREVINGGVFPGAHTRLLLKSRYGIICRKCGKYYVGKTATRCPHCDTANYGRKCGESGFLTPATLIARYEPHSMSDTQKRFRTVYLSNDDTRATFLDRHAQEIEDTLNRMHPARNYLDFSQEYVMVLCKRCHFAAHRGKHLCPECKKEYISGKYSTCYKCHRKIMDEIEEEDMVDEKGWLLRRGDRP